jgi:hypothetical protein
MNDEVFVAFCSLLAFQQYTTPVLEHLSMHFNLIPPDDSRYQNRRAQQHGTIQRPIN